MTQSTSSSSLNSTPAVELFSIPTTAKEQEAQNKRISELAKILFTIPSESFASLPLKVRGMVILRLVTEWPTWDEEKKKKAAAYLTPEAVSSAINQDPAAELFAISLMSIGSDKSLTVHAPGLAPERLLALLEKLAKEHRSCERLTLKRCSGITHLEFLQNFPHLIYLELQACFSITSIEGVAKCAKLQTLEIADCHGLPNLDALKGSPITNLIAKRCNRLENVSGLTDAPLQSLDLSDDHGLKTLAPVKTLVKLQKLTLKNLSSLRNITQFSHLPLTHLDISGCSVPQTELEAFRKIHTGIRIIP